MIIKISDILIKIGNDIKYAVTMPSSADLQNLKKFLKELGKAKSQKLLDIKYAYNKEAKLGNFSKGMITLLAFFALKGMSADEIQDTTFLDFNTHWKNLTVDEKGDLSDLELEKSRQLLEEIKKERLKPKSEIDTTDIPGGGDAGIEFIYPKQQKKSNP